MPTPTLEDRLAAVNALIGLDMGNVIAQINQTATETSAQAIIAALGSKATAALQQEILNQLVSGLQHVNASNVKGKFREAFEGTAIDETKWVKTIGAGDLVFLDGNVAAASYAVISKSPWNSDTETTLDTISTFEFPLEFSIGLHLSQRGVGQEHSIEVIDSDDPLVSVADISIASITQTTTTLDVTTSTAHGLVAGKAIGVKNVLDTRLNYPQLVVATVISPTRFTATAGPMGTIPSLSIGPFVNEGSVYFRPRVSRSKNGVSQIFENTTVSNASRYVRSASGDAFPSGTIAGNHSVTTGSSSSVQAVNLAYNYPFMPTTEYRGVLQADRVRFMDSAVDTASQSTNVLVKSQVVPDPDKLYKLRIKSRNAKSLTRLVAKITSISKGGTVTATVTTDAPHGLVTNKSWVQIYGVRDQAATAFPNLTASAVVKSTPTPTTFTVDIGSSSSTVSYGGYVALNQAQNLMASNGAISQVAQSVSASGGRVTLIGNATWSGILIGDTVELAGINNSTNGSPVANLDGAYRVRNIVTTSLELEPVDNRIVSDLVSLNCGGGVVKRTDVRISFVRVFDYERLRIETAPSSGGDAFNALPVAQQGNISINSPSLAAGTNVIGGVNSAVLSLVADVTSAAITTTTTTAAVTPTAGSAYQINIPVTAVSGTNTPSLDVVIQESDDNGTNWYDVYHFPRITATGIYRSPVLPLGTGTRIRYVQTVTGTTPSFTRAINRVQSNLQVPPTRQLIDRSVSLTTIGAATPILLTRDAGNSTQLVVNVGAATTSPQLQMEGSDDYGATWYAIGSPLSAVANSTVQTTVTDVNTGALRARVLSAGTGVTMGYILLKAHD